MTFDSNLFKALEERFSDAIENCGKRHYYRELGKCAPSVRIEDAPIRMHQIHIRALREQVAGYRRERLSALGINAELLNSRGIPVDSPRILWLDAFIWFVSHFNKFFDLGEHTKCFVSCIDRGTPPAKYLQHKKRYSAKRVQDGSKLDRATLDTLFSSPYLPEAEWGEYMKQKLFVDRVGRDVIAKLILEYYRPPGNKWLIMCGPGKGAPQLIKHDSVTLLDLSKYRNHCLESDLSVAFWCNVFKNHDVEVASKDGDIMLVLLLQSRYRVSRIEQSLADGDYKRFGFYNNVYMDKAITTFPENEETLVSDTYMEMCAQSSDNELNGDSQNKLLYLQRLSERRRRQEQEMDDFLGEECKMQHIVLAQDIARSGEKRFRNSTAKTKKRVNNEELHQNCDIYYDRDGKKLFFQSKIISINHLFQSIYDYSLTNYQDGLETTDLKSFLPVEQFCAMCMIGGNDYIEKPRGIGGKFIFDAYFSCMNEFGNLVYGKRIDTYVQSAQVHGSDVKPLDRKFEVDRKQIRSSGDGDGQQRDDENDVDPALRRILLSDYERYLQLTIDSSAVIEFVRSVFRIKGKRMQGTMENELRVMCANLRYSLNYFANDYKTEQISTCCFDIDTSPNGCAKSLFGYMIPNPEEPPSMHNIERAKEICTCTADEIRKYVVKRGESKIKFF